MLTKYTLGMPNTVFGGENSLSNIPDVLSSEKVKKLAVFTDKGIQGAGLLDFPLEYVKKSGVDHVILNDLPPEPSYEQAQKLVDQCREYGADFILAVGGGSVMDTAKLASVLMTDDYGIKDLLDDPKKAHKYVKTLMVPTTAGTGSEATPNAIVAVPEKQLKVGIVNNAMISDYVILDAVMIKKLPRKIAAATGIDALAHCIECFTSNKANPFSDTFALSGLELIMKSLIKACDDPDAMQDKLNMQIGSFYGGVAITASGTTAVHALSYPLGGKYHIAHGVSNAILLVPVMKFNEPEIRGLLAQVYDRCMNGNASTEESKSRAVIERLGEMVEHLDIPKSLKEWNVPESDLDSLVASGMEVTRLLVNNKRKVTPEDARMIYSQIM